MLHDLQIKVKKLHPDAVIPRYAKPGDGAMDLTAVSKTYDPETNTLSYGIGLAFEIPNGYVGLLFQRSSVYKKDLSLCNAVGVLDSGFRGEVSFKYRITGGLDYNIGNRVGQIMIIPFPKVEFELSEELSKSERGEGGYGSTGK